MGTSYGAGIEQHLTVGYSRRLSVYFGESYAVQWAIETLAQTMSYGFLQPDHVTILPDSQAALKTLKNRAGQSRQ